MKKVAIIGTQGVPARYGGFETLVENILGDNASHEISYTVFCSSKDMDKKLKSYKNARLRYMPLHANGIQSIAYDILSMVKAVNRFDTILILGVSGCLFLPVFRLMFHKKLIVNIDGLEYRRQKWGRFAKFILRKSEEMAVKYANIIIADNKGIQDYVKETYSKPSVLIAYGGDHVNREVPVIKQVEVLNKYGLSDGLYAITICRIEPENNCHITLEAFAHSGKELVFVGNWTKSEYGRHLYSKYNTHKNIHLINSLYDLDALYTLRSHCHYYIHGHSAGGTNPSLVEAMFFGKPIFAFDVLYNRETTMNKACYFKDDESLISLLDKSETELSSVGASMIKIANKHYLWKDIAKKYEDLY